MKHRQQGRLAGALFEAGRAPQCLTSSLDKSGPDLRHDMFTYVDADVMETEWVQRGKVCAERDGAKLVYSAVISCTNARGHHLNRTGVLGKQVCEE